MDCNILEKNKKIKEFCLKRRLKKLISKKEFEIAKIIDKFPMEASRMDSIEKSFPSQVLVEVDFKIKATARLLQHISKN